MNGSEFDIKIIKTKIEKEYDGTYSCKSKILLTNNTNYKFSLVEIEARFYDKKNNVVDVDKKPIFNIRPHSESVQILDFEIDDNRFKTYGLRVGDALIENS